MTEYYNKLVELVKDAGIIGSVRELLEWDELVTMPPGTVERRGLQKAALAAHHHKLATSDKIGELISKAESERLNDEQKAMVREIKFDYEREKKVPEQLVKELQITTTQANEAWEKAREKNDFASFAPHLKKIIELEKQKAKAINPEKKPYEVLVEDYESGISLDEMRKIFGEIKKQLVPLIEKISKAKQHEDKMLHEKVPLVKQKTFNEMLAKYIGYDFTKGRLDESTHPFTGFDSRITTRYTDSGVHMAMLSTIHEAGHGKYEQGLAEEHFGTPLGQARSMSVHESQSRLWENHVGKSMAFWKGMFAKLQKEYKMQNVSLEQFYQAINKVTPNLIRVDSDEVTYTMHIILRFELEEALIDGKIQVEDLPKEWNKRIKEYLHIDVPDDAHGVLQDIHWSAALIGYFPTYALGSLMAAQIFETAKKSISGLEQKIEAGDFKELNKFLAEKIHKPGRRHTTKELIKLATGEEPNTQAYINYLQNKFGQLYGLE